MQCFGVEENNHILEDELVFFGDLAYFFAFFSDQATWCILSFRKSVSHFPTALSLHKAWHGISAQQPTKETKAWLPSQTENTIGKEDSGEKKGKRKKISLSLKGVIIPNLQRDLMWSIKLKEALFWAALSSVASSAIEIEGHEKGARKHWKLN